MTYLNITQKWGGGTHRYGYPIDNAGKNIFIDNCYAPFDGVIKKIYNNGNSVWLESSSKVTYANGVVDYAVFMATHDNNVSDLKVGQRIKQGQVFYQEGTAGKATGNHVHIECGKGKFLGTGWYQAPNGQWVINNPVKPTDLFFLTDKNVVIQTLGLKFKYEEKFMIEEQPPVFKAQYYLDNNPDLKRKKFTLKQAKEHWLKYGIKEGRNSAPNFHVKEYLANYADLQKAFGKTGYANAVKHYFNNGINEGRSGTKLSTVQKVMTVLKPGIYEVK